MSKRLASISTFDLKLLAEKIFVSNSVRHGHNGCSKTLCGVLQKPIVQIMELRFKLNSKKGDEEVSW